MDINFKAAISRKGIIMRIVLLNTSIITCEGRFSYEKTSLEKVKREIELMGNHRILSAIGHQSTADILSELIGMKIEVNRINYEQDDNDLAVVFKLRGRPEEGKILTKAEIEEIGYDFYFLKRTGDVNDSVAMYIKEALARLDEHARRFYNRSE